VVDEGLDGRVAPYRRFLPACLRCRGHRSVGAGLWTARQREGEDPIIRVSGGARVHFHTVASSLLTPRSAVRLRLSFHDAALPRAFAAVLSFPASPGAMRSVTHPSIGLLVVVRIFTAPRSWRVGLRTSQAAADDASMTCGSPPCAISTLRALDCSVTGSVMVSTPCA
jgi:hypothetical protein